MSSPASSTSKPQTPLRDDSDLSPYAERQRSSDFYPSVSHMTAPSELVPSLEQQSFSESDTEMRNIERSISPRIGHPQQQVSEARPADPEVRVFVAGLSQKTNTPALAGMFKKHRGFVSAQIHMSRGTDYCNSYGFVFFRDTASAKEAVGRFKKQSHKVRAAIYRNGDQATQAAQQDGVRVGASEVPKLPLVQLEKRLIRNLGDVSGEKVVQLMRDIDARYRSESPEHKAVRFVHTQFCLLEAHFYDVDSLRPEFKTVEALSDTYDREPTMRRTQSALFTAICRIWEVYHQFFEMNKIFPMYPAIPGKVLHLRDRLRSLRHTLAHCVGTAAHFYVDYEDVYNFLYVDKDFDLLVSEFSEMKGAWSRDMLERIREGTSVMTEEVEGFFEEVESALVGGNQFKMQEGENEDEIHQSGDEVEIQEGGQ